MQGQGDKSGRRMRRPYGKSLLEWGVNSVNSIAVDPESYPENWRLLRLGDICKTTSGGTPSRKNPAYYVGNIPWVKSGELPDGPVMEIEESVSEDAIKNSSAKVFPRGTLLIAMYGATVGKLGVLNCGAATNQAVCAIFPSEGLEAKYLFWYLRAVRPDLIAQAVGGAQPNISQRILREITIPIAPLAQQTRIVAEIEKQFSRLDEAVANLKRVKANLKRYKAAVLKAAVEGKLTEEWRKQHPDVEPADKLLERILEERRANWQGRGKYKEPVAPDTSGLPEVPERWVWIEFQLVADVVDPQPSHRTPVKVEGGVPYIGIGDIDKEGHINFDAARKVSPDVLEEHRERYQLKDGDFIFGKIGTIGRPIYLTKPYDYTLSANVVLMQPHTRFLHPELAFMYMASPVLDKIIRKESRATTQAAFGIKKIRVIPFPLPPTLEQEEIVKEAARQLSVLEVLCEEVDAGLRRSEHLRNSILKKAFSGQLMLVDTASNAEAVNV